MLDVIARETPNVTPKHTFSDVGLHTPPLTVDLQTALMMADRKIMINFIAIEIASEGSERTNRVIVLACLIKAHAHLKDIDL